MKKIFLFVVLLFISNTAFPCSCIGKSKMKNEIKASAAVFAGTVLSKRIFSLKDDFLPEKFWMTQAEYTILVTKRYKGKVSADTLKVVTGVGGGDCGVVFQIGQSYIVYSSIQDSYYNDGDKVPPFLSTNICTKTAIYNEEESRKIERYVRRKKIKIE